MKKITAILFLIIFSACLFAQDEYKDSRKEFSFYLPENWQSVRYQNMKYNLILGERLNKITQTIVINSEKFDGDMKEYIAYSKNTLKEYFPNMNFVKTLTFENYENIDACKFIAENDYEIAKLRQYYYIFKNNDMFYVCVASTATETSEEIEELFDESMRSFKFLKQAKASE